MTSYDTGEKLRFGPILDNPRAAFVGSPGVIREIVNMLWAYGVRKIYGIKGGYKGVMEPETWPPG